jgi:predicted phage baseplate assembly protein
VTIPVVEGRTVTDFLGRSDGTPYQRFPLTHAGLILRSFAEDEVGLTVAATDTTTTTWRLRETLAFSGASDLDFTVEVDDVDRAEVVFGNSWPPADSELRAHYRVGGGEHGNVAANTAWTIADAPGLHALEPLTVTVITRDPAVGGAARESIAHAVAQAPSVFRSLSRAVTANDFVTLALRFPGVGKARAQAKSWKNLVEVMVAPAVGGVVSDGMKADLLTYFEDKRPIGTRVEITSFKYLPIFVTVVVDVEPFFSSRTVAEQVEAAVRGVLAFDRVDLGEVVYLSKFFEAIEAIDGVAGVNITRFSTDEEQPAVAPNGKLCMEPNQLPQATDGIRVETIGGAA